MIYIASDHAGFKLKKYLVKYLENQMKIDFQDMGPAEFNQTDDFPDFAIPLSKKVSEDKTNRGILICGSGHGMCITANKIKGVRAVIGYSIEGAQLARQHNNANVLCLAGRVLTEDHAGAIIKKFLTTAFEADPRLIRRNKKIEELEN
ncbi:MAG: RpiB/LacA/LacB family sugar-phosphate isomerase [bacterium]